MKEERRRNGRYEKTKEERWRRNSRNGEMKEGRKMRSTSDSYLSGKDEKTTNTRGD